MTSPTRREVLQVLGELSEHCPDMRCGQLIVNLSVVARGATAEAVWDMEDDELLAAARRELAVLRKRAASLA
ncbi:MAG: hypothetical protein KY476_04210 [Planctomycetes bacterium]|nr:hypothetical protein [Planctomycetota bacterium]